MNVWRHIWYFTKYLATSNTSFWGGKHLVKFIQEEMKLTWIIAMLKTFHLFSLPLFWLLNLSLSVQPVLWLKHEGRPLFLSLTPQQGWVKHTIFGTILHVHTRSHVSNGSITTEVRDKAYYAVCNQLKGWPFQLSTHSSCWKETYSIRAINIESTSLANDHISQRWIYNVHPG